MVHTSVISNTAVMPPTIFGFYFCRMKTVAGHCWTVRIPSWGENSCRLGTSDEHHLTNSSNIWNVGLISPLVLSLFLYVGKKSANEQTVSQLESLIGTWHTVCLMIIYLDPSIENLKCPSVYEPLPLPSNCTSMMILQISWAPSTKMENWKLSSINW